mmetsp:Transcript_69054/g.192227  ORF Transcript_69054/g.192227 Transcript_69054/m.192227 type:complete len:248 (+) Transcript_69054:1181-1924(+)
MSEQPMESEIVTQSGMPSGMAATASVTDMRIMYSQEGLLKSDGFFVLRATPSAKTTTQTPMASTPMRDPKASTFACKGVAFEDVSGKHPHRFFPVFPSSAIRRAMPPMRVFMPVATTMPLALPLVTLQPENTMVSGVSFSPSPDVFFFANFATSSGSPVRHISLTFKSSASYRRMSAGTTSPVPKSTMSPDTSVVVSILSSTPPRSTETVACDIFDNASRASPALFSVYAAIPAFRSTSTTIALPVV